VKSSVYPSGAARATALAPIEPEPPTRFSITTGLPQCSVSFWPTRRAITSSGPPAVKGTTNFTGRDGYAS